MEIVFDLQIRRETSFWREFNTELVQDYVRRLQEAKEELKKIRWVYESKLWGNRSLIDGMINEIDTELKYCQFYEEYAEREKTDPMLNMWVFTKKEDIKPVREWMKPQGDRWIKTNGRIRATIEIDRSGVMTKITLEYDNDSDSIEFLDRHRRNKSYNVAHLRNEDSIQQRISDFKEIADEFMIQHLFPTYYKEKWNYKILLKFLHINSSKEIIPE